MSTIRARRFAVIVAVVAAFALIALPVLLALG